MSASLTLNALVLREVSYRENDKLLTLLTAERGRLTASAHGVKSPKSRRRAACQSLTYGEFTLSEYRDRFTVTEAVVLEPFLPLREDIVRLALGAYFCQTLETCAPEGVDCRELLRLGLNALYAIGREGAEPELIRAAFELRLACETGFMPELDACPVCGNESPDRFSPSDGCVHCAACPREGASLPLSPPALAALRRAATCDLRRLAAFSVEGSARREFCDAAEGYLLSSFETSFKTLDFYKSIL